MVRPQHSCQESPGNMIRHGTTVKQPHHYSRHLCATRSLSHQDMVVSMLLVMHCGGHAATRRVPLSGLHFLYFNYLVLLDPRAPVPPLDGSTGPTPLMQDSKRASQRCIARVLLCSALVVTNDVCTYKGNGSVLAPSEHAGRRESR